MTRPQPARARPIGQWDPDVYHRFDALCSRVAARGKGLTLVQLGAAGDLAAELAQDDPDRARVEELAGRLGLDPDAVLELGGP